MLFQTTKRRPATAAGFTLVELLVVITIIGILVAMLLPALGGARESSRKATCANNVKQLALAVVQHETNQGYYPTGGWGWCWVGDPDRGYATNQPGGWLYNILPNIDMVNLHDLGRYGDANAKKTAAAQMVGTPLPLTNCPTRRRPALFKSAGVAINNAGGVPLPANNARTDYAINVGSGVIDEYWGGPGSDPGTVKTQWHSALTDCTGISFECSTIRQADIAIKGTSNLMMLGEKYLGLDCYDTGKSGADNENQYVGMDNDIGRCTGVVPMQDRWGVNSTFAFGSAHANSFNAAACDGSVHTIGYSVDATAFLNLGNRTNDAVVDWEKIH